MEASLLSPVVLDRIQSIVGRPPSSHTQYVNRWEGEHTMPLSVERRGTRHVCVWLPAILQPQTLPYFAETYPLV